MSSSELDITMADLQETIQCASVDIPELLHVAQMMSGSTKMEAAQQLYCITVSIPNTFINTQSIVVNKFHKRNGLPLCGGSWAYQMWRSTHSFQSHTPCSVSAKSWVCYNSHELFSFPLTLTPLWLILPTLMTHCSHTHSTMTHQPLLYFYYIYG